MYARNTKDLASRIERATRLGSDLVEARIDLLAQIRFEELARIVTKHRRRLILTCRPTQEGGGFDGTEEERLEVLQKLSRLGSAFLDVELSLARKHPRRLRDLSKNLTALIISWHDFERTPADSKLKERVNEALKLGDIAKIVPTAREFRDNLTVLSLYDDHQEDKLVAFCMGEKGIVSRLLCPLLGSPFTYASLPGQPTAEGQPSVEELRSLLALIRMGT